MTWQRTSRPNSTRTIYTCGDYTITGRDDQYRSGKVFYITCMGELLDVTSTLRLAKEVAADHFNGL